jgi:uncharacterized protein YdhG (YjbR/CyaY superfamily)
MGIDLTLRHNEAQELRRNFKQGPKEAARKMDLAIEMFQQVGTKIRVVQYIKRRIPITEAHKNQIEKFKLVKWY